MKYTLLILAAFFSAARPEARTDTASVRRLIDSFYRAVPAAKGIIVHIESPGRKLSWSAAAGVSDTVSRKPLRAVQPVLIASNTKTYVAAAVLKLQEEGRLNIEQAIGTLLPRKTIELLRKDGYDPDAILVKHLLSHSSGIADYVNDAYFDAVDADKRHRWTRDEQIQLAMTTGKPMAAPGDTFKYADVNYLLLTEIIETKTGKPFPAAIRDLLQYHRIGLRQTWFTTLEPEPEKTLAQAHQYWRNKHWDSYAFDPSWDLYGGGGIVATAKDMALFFQALFDGKIIRDPAVLRLIHEPVMPGEMHNYCLGLRILDMDGFPAYYHGGFWGTDAAYFPDIDASIAIVVLERDQRDISGAICRRIAAALRSGK